MKNYLSTLESAIFIAHKRKPIYRARVFVREQTSDGEPVWEGPVEVFDLADSRTGEQCYAWEHTDDRGKEKIITVLGSDLINSAQQAVRAAVFSDAQPPARNFASGLEEIRRQLEECKELLRKMGMRAEDVVGSIVSTREIRENIQQQRGR